MKKDTLVIIGNGFDLWQNLKTSYKDFYNYYLQNRFEICKQLKINTIEYKLKDQLRKATPVELIYGEVFEKDLDFHNFWNTFEESLGDIDAFKLNSYYGKELDDLDNLMKAGINAQKILNTAFCNWVGSLKIKNKQKSNIKFKENCIFINFNYTSTLEDIFGVDEDDVIHIHGIADENDSIIFGHSIHPQKPEDFLLTLPARFIGLYIIEQLLYETDKHARSNITQLCLELSLMGINAEDINDVYILGHSLSDVDFEYFKHLKSSTSFQSEYKNEQKINLKNYNPEDELHLRLSYIRKKYGRDRFNDNRITKDEELAVLKKFLFEQDETDKEILEDYFGELKKEFDIEDFAFDNDNELPPIKLSKTKKRKKEAKWHISCYNPEDEKRAKTLMNILHCKNYELYNGINKAIKNIIVE